MSLATQVCDVYGLTLSALFKTPQTTDAKKQRPFKMSTRTVISIPLRQHQRAAW